MPLHRFRCKHCQGEYWHEEQYELTKIGRLPKSLAIVECFGCGSLSVKDLDKALRSIGLGEKKPS